MTASDHRPQETAGLVDGVTLADLGFHWEGNIFWKRQGDGAVRVCLARNRLDGSDFYDMVWSYSIDPDSWASIVSSVSAGGEDGPRFWEARKFHMGGTEQVRYPNEP